MRGSYVEHAVGGAGCTAPTGLCIAATYRGSIRGTLFGQATTISPNVDIAATGVLTFTSDSSFDGSFRNRTGTLTIKNAGAFRTVGGNSIVDLQSIVGGTGDFVGATGEIRASGIFANGAGASDYVGQLCLA